MKVAIIDYGMGNLVSVKRAFEECGADVFIATLPHDIDRASYLVLPGVGSFAMGMDNLQSQQWVETLQEAVIIKQKPILGICLGMQLLADLGYEGGETAGLGFIPGKVKLLETNHENERIPHVGWNEIHCYQNSRLFENIKNRSDFYFVHSYHFIPDRMKNIFAVTPYCGGFVSVVGHNHILGVQFHPEKSHRNGFNLIKNFLNFSL
jgi:imidazole glycerol-phosphate synthase subunit HisH